jgi:hypothetical protein
MINTSGHQNDDVLYTVNDEVYHPIIQNNFLMVIKFICCLIGIPLNVSIAITIIRRRNLRTKPRNIFLLGIILSYVSFFVPAIIELLYWGPYPIDSVCQSYVAVVALPHGLLLSNMLLALADRYVAINHALFHRKKMTVRFASVLIILSSTSTVFLMKFVYILRLGPLRCEMWLVHIKIMAVVLTVLFVPCTVLTIIVHRQLKTLGRQSRTPSPTTIFDDPHMAVVDIGNVEWIELASTGNETTQTNTSEHSTIVRSMSIRLDGEMMILSGAEIEGARTLVIGFTPVVVMTYCGIIFVSTFVACRLFGQFQCVDLSWMGPYVKELSLIPAFYGSLIFLSRNKELRSAYTCHKK